MRTVPQFAALKRILVSTLVQAAIALVLVSPAAAREIPRTVLALKNAPPTFVRLDTVFTPAGDVDPSLFSPSEARTIRAYLQLPEENGCVRLRGLIYDYVNQGPSSSLDAATRKAKLLLRGLVTAAAPGFRGTEAGTLLEITPQEVVKGFVSPRGGPYYVFVPIAFFTIKDRKYCAFNPDYPSLPEVGDQLLVFVRDTESFGSSFLPLFDGTDLIVLKKDAGVDLPRLLKSDTKLRELHAQGLMELVRSKVAEEPAS
jgi:hypothetical protein